MRTDLEEIWYKMLEAKGGAPVKVVKKLSKKEKEAAEIKVMDQDFMANRTKQWNKKNLKNKL